MRSVALTHREKSKKVLLYPETSVSSFVTNLFSYYPHLNDVQILMDVNDYQRIQRLASESKEYLFQSIILKNLMGLRTLKLIDYKEYYTKSEIRQNCKEINRFIPKIKDDEINHLAEEAGYSWLNYAINETKKNIYKTIDEKSWRNLRSSEDDALNKLNILSKGGGDSSLN